MSEMTVDIVAVERSIWSGEATFVFARTLNGEIGILPRHIPLMAELVDDATVRIDTVENGSLTFAVDGGFLSVTEKGVTILAEEAELSDDIDADKAQSDAESDDAVVSARGRARLRALGRQV
ncbi:F0F1 ATP synthase subunit epsilon [Antrihabitans cavernicola]|uniref:ATP synthase epsilon chain n=1 Tax=Antrihabitans cavernicola TaxID=2495913 RepID=A0A5A7S2D2_9NOCA|nr:F0F1 ATP synthase subunit epsilon [Spelaeibacter cavernicola]KAA0018041.1 F0F1 ATP synthase subunit epsilon [Spelaeibacter cavernicola]